MAVSAVLLFAVRYDQLRSVEKRFKKLCSK